MSYTKNVYVYTLIDENNNLAYKKAHCNMKYAFTLFVTFFSNMHAICIQYNYIYINKY